MCDASLRLQGHSLGAPPTLPRPAKAARNMARAASSHSGERQPDKALPNGVWWLDKASHSHDILYGENFVVQRPKLGGEGLIPYQEGLTRIQLMPSVPSPSARSRAPLLPPGRDSVYDIMDYTLEESPEHRSAQLQLPAPAEPQVAGLVLWRPGDAQEAQASAPQSPEASTSHPRRTKAVQYTCKRCGTISTKLVNPHVWATGSVFAKCDGCGVIHKLMDNLQVYHEVGGRGSLDYDPDILNIPAGLFQKPDRHIKVSGVEFPM